MDHDEMPWLPKPDPRRPVLFEVEPWQRKLALGMLAFTGAFWVWALLGAPGMSRDEEEDKQKRFLFEELED